MKNLSVSHTKSKTPNSRPNHLTRSAASNRFEIGAEAPPLSEKAKTQLNHKRPSKRAAKLAAIASKANVRCRAVV